MSASSYEGRREKLRKLMRAEGLDALLVSLDANRYYLSGFELIDHQVNESAGCLLICANGKDWLCTDSRYLDAAKRLWDESRILIYGANAAEAISKLVRANTSGTVGFEEGIMNCRFYAAFSPGIRLKAADGLVERLRLIKDADEIARMDAAVRLNHKLMDWLPSQLVPGKSEKALAWDVERFFRENGAESLAFPSITAVGPNAALPHAVPGDDVIRENCCVLVDVGCRVADYCSDQTRTFWVGDKPTEAFLETITLVRTAQELAIKAIHPGVKTADVYAAARNFLDEKKVGSFFTHGLGHGIGLQTHEGPSLNPRNASTLEPGMVVTVEPGLYYPQWGGVRWEYMIHVTEDGARIM